MNWFGQQQGEGFEYHLLVIGMSAALVLTGGGAWSLDRVIVRWLGSEPEYAARSLREAHHSVG